MKLDPLEADTLRVVIQCHLRIHTKETGVLLLHNGECEVSTSSGTCCMNVDDLDSLDAPRLIVGIAVGVCVPDRVLTMIYSKIVTTATGYTRKCLTHRSVASPPPRRAEETERHTQHS
jgi:hypothetical protein